MTYDSKDLEVVLTALELAAISLTADPTATFSREQLLQEAQSFDVDEVALRNVLGTVLRSRSGFLRKIGDRLQMK